MKISKDAMKVLDNFTRINQSIYVEKGNVIKTISPSKNLLAKAILPDTFPSDFAIYQTKVFLNMISLMGEPEIEFDEKFVYIRDEERGISSKVRLTSKDMILSADYSKDVKLPSVDAEFDLSSDNMKLIQKASMSIINEDEIAFIGKDGKIFISTYISQMENTDDFMIEIGETDKEFTTIIALSNLKMLEGSYRVKLSFRGIIEFSHTTNDGSEITYWTTVSDKSKV